MKTCKWWNDHVNCAVRFLWMSIWLVIHKEHDDFSLWVKIVFVLATVAKSTFYLFILLQDLPEGSWYCPNCTCWICGDLVNDKEASSSVGAYKCLQCEHKCTSPTSILFSLIVFIESKLPCNVHGWLENWFRMHMLKYELYMKLKLMLLGAGNF